MEREGVSILSICSFVRALGCLAHLKNTSCFVCLKSILKKAPWYDKLYNVSRIGRESIQSVLKMFLERVLCMYDKMVLFLESIYELSTLPERLFFSSFPLDNAILL